MLRTKEYIESINKQLPRGSRRNIAKVLGVSESLVKMTLQGHRENLDVLILAENVILTQGAEYIPVSKYIPLSYSIAQKRTEQPFTYLKKEIFQFIMPGLNFSDN